MALLVIAFGCATCWGNLALGNDGFRVENRVLRSDGSVLLDESTTLFHGGRGYDFSERGGHVTVFDPQVGQYVLLDPVRRMQVRLGFAEVAKFLEEMRQHALGFPNELVRFQARPELDETFDATREQLQLDSRWLTYDVSTVAAPTRSMASEYLSFCDGLARLNAHINAGSSPPFARLAVNAALARRGRLPARIVRTAYPSKKSRKNHHRVRSEHTFHERLRAEDGARVADVQRQLEEFTVVALSDFYPRTAKK